MNKAELLSQLNQKFIKVGTVEEAYVNAEDKAIREAEGVKFYKVAVYAQTGETGVRRVVYFYVKDEGQPSEDAFFHESEPAGSILAQDFRGEVEDLIDAKVQAGTLVRGEIIKVNNSARHAVVRAFVIEVKDVVEKLFFVYRDTDDTNKMTLFVPLSR